jgi:AsmA protein
MAWRTLPRAIRIGVWSVAGAVGLLIAAVVVFALSFDPDRYKPQVIAAVKEATGRDLTLQGRIHLGLSLQPTLTVEGVSLANPPGFSRPEMATLERLDLKLALIPLLSHRVEIDRLVLVKPDIVLETSAQGQPNWQFASRASPAAPQQPAGDNQRQSTSTRITVAEVRIENGILTWRDDRTGRSTVLGIASLRADAASPDANVDVKASATYDRTPFSLDGELGPLTRLQDPTSTTPWPVRMRIEAVGAKLALDGTLTQPMQGRGYAMKLTADIPDLAALTPFLGGQRAPPLRDVSLAAQITDTGATLPEISSLTLHVGPSDLSGTVAGLKLDKLDIDAPRLDQPMHVAAQGSFNAAPATVSGTLGSPAAFVATVKAPVPIDLSVQGLGSNLTIKGTVGQGAGARPSVQAQVTSDKIDLDALSAAIGKPPAEQAAVAKPSPAPKPAASGRMIPDTPIPFDLLRLADADVKLNVAQLKSGNAVYRAIATHLNLQGGKLQLDPVSADLPEGHLDGAFSADAAQGTPPVALRLRIPVLALQPLLAALNEPATISGNLSVQADLHGAGATPHAIAASLDGSVGVSMANGTIDNRVLGSTMGSILREVNLLDLVGRGGTSQVQCFAIRLDANHGIATVRPLVLASSLLTMDGDGTLNLGGETLDLRVRPQARVAGTGLVVPLRVTGSFRAPSTVPDPAAAVTQNAGTVAGAVLSKTTPLGIVAGALGEKKLLGGAEADCGAALAAARGGGGTPATGPAAPPAPQQQKKAPDVGGALKQLFR